MGISITVGLSKCIWSVYLEYLIVKCIGEKVYFKLAMEKLNKHFNEHFKIEMSKNVNLSKF